MFTSLSLVTEIAVSDFIFMHVYLNLHASLKREGIDMICSDLLYLSCMIMKFQQISDGSCVIVNVSRSDCIVISLVRYIRKKITQILELTFSNQYVAFGTTTLYQPQGHHL